MGAGSPGTRPIFEQTPARRVQMPGMNTAAKADRIRLLDFRSPPMRAFHMSWMAFFLSFLAWYGLAPLMPIIRQEMALTKEQIGYLLIAAVSLAVPTRLLIGWCCDRFGPRRSYGWLMIVFAFPIMGVTFAKDFHSLLIFRLLIGGIGASFVITQFHSTLMFAPKCVGTANATTAGWGNMGGGMAQVLMPFLTGTFIAWGATSAVGWRLSMVTVGAACLVFGIMYLFLTQDTPAGDFAEIPAEARKTWQGRRQVVARPDEPGVWVLVIAYAACFGVELTMKNMLVLYYTDYFDAFKKMTAVDAAKWCGLIASGYGFMNLFCAHGRRLDQRPRRRGSRHFRREPPCSSARCSPKASSSCSSRAPARSPVRSRRCCSSPSPCRWPAARPTRSRPSSNPAPSAARPVLSAPGQCRRDGHGFPLQDLHTLALAAARAWLRCGAHLDPDSAGAILRSRRGRSPSRPRRKRKPNRRRRKDIPDCGMVTAI